MKKIIIPFIMSLIITPMFYPIASYADEIQNINITDISPVKIDVGNYRVIQEGGAAVAGAAISWSIAHYMTSASPTVQAVAGAGGAAAGTYLASKFGTDQQVDGAKIYYSVDGNKETIEVTGDPCMFHIGTAFLITDDKGNRKIHQNASSNTICKPVS